MEGLRDWWETRRLTTRRAGGSSRHIASERIDRYIRSRATATLVVSGVIVVVGVLEWLVLGARPEIRGLAVGMTVGVSFTLLYHWIVIASGAHAGVIGQAAEQWTDLELRRLRRKGWKYVNRVEIKRDGDIDHVAVGPDGVVVIETKWRAAAIDVDDGSQWIQDAVQQARRNRDQVRRLLGWREREDRPIVALVVLWGPQVRQRSGEAVLVDDVNVIAGEHLRAELEALADVRLSADEIETVHQKLVERIAYVDNWDAANAEPRPPTLQEIADRWLTNTCAAFIGLMVGLCSLALGLWAAAALVGALSLAGVAVRRVEALRSVTTWFVLGLLLTIPVLAGAVVWAVVTQG